MERLTPDERARKYHPMQPLMAFLGELGLFRDTDPLQLSRTFADLYSNLIDALLEEMPQTEEKPQLIERLLDQLTRNHFQIEPAALEALPKSEKIISILAEHTFKSRMKVLEEWHIQDQGKTVPLPPPDFFTNIRKMGVDLLEARDKARAHLIAHVRDGKPLDDEILTRAGVHLTRDQEGELARLRSLKEQRPPSAEPGS